MSAVFCGQALASTESATSQFVCLSLRVEFLLKTDSGYPKFLVFRRPNLTTTLSLFVIIKPFVNLRVAYPGGEAVLRGPDGRIWPDNFLPWGTVLNFSQRRRRVLVEAPERVTPRVYQGNFWTVPLCRLMLSCSDGLIYTGRHTFRRHASPPRSFVWFESRVFIEN